MSKRKKSRSKQRHNDGQRDGNNQPSRGDNQHREGRGNHHGGGPGGSQHHGGGQHYSDGQQQQQQQHQHHGGGPYRGGGRTRDGQQQQQYSAPLYPLQHETFAVFPGQPVVDQSYHHQSGSAIPFAQPQTQQNPFAPAPVPAPAVVPIPAQWTQQQAQPQPSAPAQTQWAQQLQPQPQAQPYATAYQPLPDDCSKCGYCAETRAVVEKVASYVTDLHGVVRHTASFLANWSGLDVPSAQQHLQQLPHQPTPQPAQQPAQPQQPVLQQLASSSCCPPILGSWQTTDYYPVEMEMCSETGPCGLEEAQQPEAEPPAAPAPSLFATTFSPPQEMENVPRQVQASQAKFNPFATQQPAAPSQPYTDQQQQQQPPTGAQGYQQQQQQQQDNIIPPNPNLNPNPNTGDGQQQSTSRTWSNYRSRCG